MVLKTWTICQKDSPGLPEHPSIPLPSLAFSQVVLELKSAVEQRLGLTPISSSPELAELDAGEGGAGALPDQTPTPTSTEVSPRECSEVHVHVFQTQALGELI